MTGWLTARDLVDDLATISLPNVFNPYRDHCSLNDLVGGAAIRRRNLEMMIDAALASGAPELWVGLELGSRGGRRTGLPLTDEICLEVAARYWNLPGFIRATTGEPVREQTARFIWDAVADIPDKVFFWNAFPLHCHQPGSINNRGHTPSERTRIPAILPWLVDRLGVERVVALGRDAEIALERLGIPSRYVRHPGRGGGPRFLSDICR